MGMVDASAHGHTASMSIQQWQPAANYGGCRHDTTAPGDQWAKMPSSGENAHVWWPSMPRARNEDMRRRLRAAMALGGYRGNKQLAAALARNDSGIGARTLTDILATGDATAAQRREIARACQVPLDFIEHGLQPEPDRDELAEQIRTQQASLDSMVDTVRMQQEALEEVSGDVRDLRLAVARAGIARAESRRLRPGQDESLGGSGAPRPRP